MSNPDLLAAIDLVTSWQMAGWGEYLVWELIQGERTCISPLFPDYVLTDAQLMMFMRLRDEHRVWFFHQKGKWKMIDVTAWREHTSMVSAEDAVRAIERGSGP